MRTRTRGRVANLRLEVLRHCEDVMLKVKEIENLAGVDTRQQTQFGRCGGGQDVIEKRRKSQRWRRIFFFAAGTAVGSHKK